METKATKYRVNVQESTLPNLTLRNCRTVKSSFHVPHRQKKGFWNYGVRIDARHFVVHIYILWMRQ